MRSRRTTIAVTLFAILAVVAVDALAQGRLGRRRPPEARPEGYGWVGPDVGDRAPDFVLSDTDGNVRELSELWGRAPLILILGSYTSPEFRATVNGVQSILEAHPREISAAVLYTAEAHPSGSKSPFAEGESVPEANVAQGFTLEQPADMEARLAAARLTVEKLRIQVPVLVDGMDDAAAGAYGPAPNNAFLIDRHGYVVERQGWFDPESMERSVQALLRLQRPDPEPGEPDR